MTDIPAGWYNDPEDAAQLRYWDGLQWTDHRSPVPTHQNVASGESMAVVNGAFALLRDRWVSLLAIAGLGVAIAIAGVVIGVLGLSLSLEPGLFDIIETTTDANFNPDIDPVDEAFVDSITWEWNAGIVLVVAGWLLFLIGMYGGMAAGTLHLASARAGRPRNATACVAMMLRRAPRWVGIGLLWSLVSSLAVAAVVAVFVVGVMISPVILVILVPAALAGVIYGWPFMQLSGTGLLLAPRGTPPFRHVVSLVRANWGGIALRCLVVNLIAFAFNIAMNVVGLIPLVGLLISIPATFALYSYSIGANLLIYEYAGGSVDATIPDAVAA
ncbi:MAG: DUF2510 domain-containing protein [Acidimicrobiales bacterium]